MARGAADREPASPRWHAPPERIGPGTAIPIAGLVLGVAATVLLLRAPAVDSQPLRAVPLTRLAGRESAPAFAPDGEQVAFVWSGEKSDNVDIYVTLVGSTSVRRLTTDSADDFGPSWSPDGRRIAFLRRSGHSARVHITSAVGGPDLKLSDFPVGVVEADRIFGAQIAWSPDGRQIVAGRDPRASEGVSAGLYLIPVDGGEPRALTRPTHPAFDLAPAFSANGRRLAVLACRSIGPFLPSLWPGECVVRATDLDDGMPKTAPRTLTMDPVEPLGLAWSRDGTSIIYTSGHPGPVRLWRLWINASRPAELIEMAGEAADTRQLP